MANWISSKLKVAENFLEQIDQQAADSLKKNERPRSDDQKFNLPAKTGGSVSLKDQLKRKTHEINDCNEYSKENSNADSAPNKNVDSHSSRGGGGDGGGGNSNDTSSNIDKDILKISPKPKAMLTDSDWTELLGTPTKTVSTPNRTNVVSAIRGLRKDGRRQGVLGSGSNILVGEGKRDRRSSGGGKNSGALLNKRLDVDLPNRLNGRPSNGEESSSSSRSSNVELQSDDKVLEGKEVEKNDVVFDVMGKRKNEGSDENGGHFESKDVSEEALPVGNKNHGSEMLSALEKVDGVSNVKKGVGDVYDRLRSTVKGKHVIRAASRSSASDDLKRNSSLTSDSTSDSDSDSGSSSDSESEREREKRKKVLAEKAAAKASEAIKGRENMVARLEGEKQSLEKIVEEQAKQQVQEASELQMTMMETMEAVELEKKKHNNTRMEALARLAKLEISNADLARSLASAQKNLELEINQVAELRQNLELKEVALEELRRKISKSNQNETYLNQAAASKGVEFEQEILEAEYSFITDKIGRLEEKAKKLEADIEMTRKEMEDPTEVEIELKRRLGQLTDHLIQKQAQVEALSSEKATLHFRIEAVSRLLDENELETGTLAISDSKLGPMFEDKFRAGRKHLGSLVRQLDAIFLAGVVFLRRNPTAKLWCVVYLVCLHFWVIYILMARFHPSNEGRSGAVFSLENINNTAVI